MIRSDYTYGTITLTNGEDEFTGTGTLWVQAKIGEGDTIFDLPGTAYQAVIQEITGQGSGLLTKPWEGPTMTTLYRMRYQPDGSRVPAQAAQLVELLGNGNLLAFAQLAWTGGIQVPAFNGAGAMILVPKTDLTSGADYDVQVANLAARATYDAQTTGFAVLVSNVGDGRAAIYSKVSDTSGNWSAPAYVTGPSVTLSITNVDEVPYGTDPEVTITPIAGGYELAFEIPRGMIIEPGTTTTLPPNEPADVTFVPITGGYRLDLAIPSGRGSIPRGNYNPVTSYVRDDTVLDNGSSWILTANTSTGNAPPVLPATSNAFWQLLARKGTDGTGTGNVVGPALSVDNRIALFDGTSGLLIKDSGKTLAEIGGNLFKTSNYGHDIQAAMNACTVVGGGVVEVDLRGTIAPASALIIPSNVSLIGMGRDTVINVAPLTSGQLSGLYAVKKNGAGLTSLGSTFTGIVAGDDHITFASAPAVDVGQVICIYDSADGSFLPVTSGFGGRTMYRRGQRARVIAKSGNTIYLDQPINVAYESGGTVTIYKQASASGKIAGLTIDATGYVTAGIMAMQAKWCDNLVIDDIAVLGAAYAGLEIWQSYWTRIDRVDCTTNLATASANSYPLSIVNCSHTRASNFTARGKWNGVGTGGGDEAGAIQNFDSLFTDFKASGVDAPGVDVHGNSEDTRFVRGKIDNGISFGGKNTIYEDCDTTDGDYLYLAVFAEVWGGVQAYRGGTLTMKKANYNFKEAIGSYASGTAFRSAQAETFVEFKGCVISAPLAAWLFGFNTDSTTKPVSFDIDVRLTGVGSLTNFMEIYCLSGVGAAVMDRVKVENLPNNVPYQTFSGSTPYTAVKYEFPHQTVSMETSMSATDVLVTPIVTFAHAYPVAPKCSLVMYGSPVVASVQPYDSSYPSKTQMRATLRGAANFSASGTITTVADVWV
jgi:hypothetical protein